MKGTIFHAYIISYVSLAITVVAFLVGFVLAIITKSASTLGYSLENFVDSITSGLVLWRFWGGGKTVAPEVLHLREKRASVGIGLVFIALAVTVVATAATHLVEATKPSEPLMLMGLSLPSVVVFGALGAAKLWLGSAEQLDSPSMRKDGLCSVSGAALSAAVFLSSALQYYSENGEGVWWLDGAAAVVISAVLLGVGMRTVVHNIAQGNKFWTLPFWTEDPVPAGVKLEDGTTDDNSTPTPNQSGSIELERPVTSPMA